MASSAPTSNPHPSESRPDDHAWETDHPYKKPTSDDDDDNNKPAWEGSCHCGRVQYTISREKPLASKYCHCTDCQRMHAVRPFPFPPHPFLSLPLYMSTNRKPTPPPQAPFQWAAIFHKSDLRFRHGVQNLTFYCPTLTEPVHHLPCKVYCATCHAPIMDEGRNMVMLFPELLSAIHTDRGKAAFKLGDHICWGGRVVEDGVFEGDGVKKWAGVDGRSELIDDGTGRK